MIARPLLLVAGMLTLTAPPARASDANRGRALYSSVGCVLCHGTVGQGDGGARKLAPDPLPFETLRAFVRAPPTDAPAFNRMPAYSADILSDRDVADILAFLETVPPAKAPAQIPLLAK